MTGRPFGRPLLLSACSLVALTFRPALAHHSVAAAYDTTRTVTIDGEVQDFSFGNPHSHLTISVPNEAGSSRVWQAEMGSVMVLYRAGWTSKSLSIGERVRLTGSPSRDDSMQVYLISVIKADGTRLSTIRSLKQN
jgi:hypothetical protein